MSRAIAKILELDPAQRKRLERATAEGLSAAGAPRAVQLEERKRIKEDLAAVVGVVPSERGADVLGVGDHKTWKKAASRALLGD